MVEENTRKSTRPSFLSFFCCIKQKLSSTATTTISVDDSLKKALVENDDVYLSYPTARFKKSGWKAVTYILGLFMLFFFGPVLLSLCFYFFGKAF